MFTVYQLRLIASLADAIQVWSGKNSDDWVESVGWIGENLY